MLYLVETEKGERVISLYIPIREGFFRGNLEKTVSFRNLSPETEDILIKNLIESGFKMITEKPYIPMEDDN